MKQDRLFEWTEDIKETLENFEPNEDEEDAFGEFMKAGQGYFFSSSIFQTVFPQLMPPWRACSRARPP